MSNVVNLNKFRKKKLKAARQKQAETNRRVHGRSNAERAKEALQKKQLSSKVDQARLTSPPSSGEPPIEEN